MPHPGPDRALRRAVAELARLHRKDVEAILAELEAADRAALETLLGAYRGRSTPRPLREAGEDSRPAYEGVSPWLLSRLVGKDAPSLTPAARDALRAAAEPFRAAPPTAAPTAAAPSLLGRAWTFASGRQA
jgi:hypothetical protein